MSARDDVLARIRSANASGAAPVPRCRATTRPAGDAGPGSAEAVDLLVDRLVDYKAAVHRVPAPTASPRRWTLRSAGARRVVVPPGLDPRLGRHGGAR